jgi:hypothetical protein
MEGGKWGVEQVRIDTQSQLYIPRNAGLLIVLGGVGDSEAKMRVG